VLFDITFKVTISFKLYFYHYKCEELQIYFKCMTYSRVSIEMTVVYRK